MKTPISFYDYNEKLIIIDLSKVIAIYANNDDNNFKISVYYDHNSDSYSFKTMKEKIAVIEKIMEILNPICITYDDKRYVAEAKSYRPISEDDNN
jgi:hypothetical protein